MKNQSVSDFVAATMDAVLNSKEHKSLFGSGYSKFAQDLNDAKKKKDSSSKDSSDSSMADDDENDARKKKKEDSDDDSCMADDDENDARKHKHKDSDDDSCMADDDDNDADDNDAKKKKGGCKECGGKLVFGKCPKCDKKSDSSDADDNNDEDAKKPVVSGGQPGKGDTGAPGSVVFQQPAQIHSGNKPAASSAPKASGDSHAANTLASSQKNPYPKSMESGYRNADVLRAEDGEVSAAYDVAIDSLLTASAALDSLALGRGSALTLKIASLVVEAKKKDKDSKKSKKDSKDSKKSSKDSQSAKDKKSSDKKDSKKDDKKDSKKSSDSKKK